MSVQKRIALVGSGISGLGALYTLRNSGHDVHLYEADDRLGGHTNTVPFEDDGKKIMVDTGFIVMNMATYPNFIPFLKELGVETLPTAMTFGVSRDYGAFEWSGTSVSSIFAQRENIFRPKFWWMIFDIVRFNLFALDMLTETDGTLSNDNEMTIGEYLEREGYSEVFRDDYIIPMTACVWSTDADKCAMDFPAVTLVRFMYNHHLLSTIAKRPDWLTIPGGSKRYIDALMKDVPAKTVHLKSSVVSVSNENDKRVKIIFKDGGESTFDEVILACHGDQARSIISFSASDLEMNIMQNFHTSPNMVYLHSDVSVSKMCTQICQMICLRIIQLLPQRKIAWSSWNYLTTTPSSKSRATSAAAKSAPGALDTVSLTYNMNILQHIPVSKYGHVLVTMNPPHAPDPKLTQAEFSYRHPLYNAAAVRAQCRLDEIQGKRGIWYCGAWTGYGFHEDGFASGVAIGRRLGGSVPWDVVDAKFVRGRRPVLGWKDYLARIIVMLFHLVIIVIASANAKLGTMIKKKKIQ
jgi:predicted NAD/FAD-binding protein